MSIEAKRVEDPTAM